MRGSSIAGLAGLLAAVLVLATVATEVTAGEGQTGPLRVRVLWFQAQADDAASIASGRPAGFGRLGRELWRRGFESEEVTDFNLTPALLASTEIAVVAGPVRRYSDIEARDVTTWVQAGGRLLIVAGSSPAETEAKQLGKLTAPFGVRLTADRSMGAPELIRDFTAHPVTRDVAAATAARGTFLEVQPPAEVLARVEGRPVLAATEYGRGRVVVLYSPQSWVNGPPDKSSAWTSLDLDANRQLAYQVFAWLAGQTP